MLVQTISVFMFILILMAAEFIPTALEFDSRKGLHARFCVIQGCWQQGSVFNANDSFAKRL